MQKGIEGKCCVTVSSLWKEAMVRIVLVVWCWPDCCLLILHLRSYAQFIMFRFRMAQCSNDLTDLMWTCQRVCKVVSLNMIGWEDGPRVVYAWLEITGDTGCAIDPSCIYCAQSSICQICVRKLSSSLHSFNLRRRIWLRVHRSNVGEPSTRHDFATHCVWLQLWDFLCQFSRAR